MTVANPLPGARIRLADLVAAGLALAGGIHLAIGLDHGIAARGLTDHGALFAVAGAVQLTLAAGVARRAGPWAVGAAVATSLLLVGAWASTRAPIAADPEPIGLLDTITVALQSGAAVAGLVLLRRPTPVARRVVPALPALALLAVLGVAGGLAGPPPHDHNDHGHEHEDPAEAPVAAEARAQSRPNLFGDLFTAHTDGTHGTHGDSSLLGAAPEPPTSPDHDHEVPHDH